MVPGGDVIATAIAVILEPDDDHKILHRQVGVNRHDLIEKSHYADLTSAPDIYV